MLVAFSPSTLYCTTVDWSLTTHNGKGTLLSVEQAFVGKDEKRAPLKTPAWEATIVETINPFSPKLITKLKIVSKVSPLKCSVLFSKLTRELHSTSCLKRNFQFLYIHNQT